MSCNIFPLWDRSISWSCMHCWTLLASHFKMMFLHHISHRKCKPSLVAMSSASNESSVCPYLYHLAYNKLTMVISYDNSNNWCVYLLKNRYININFEKVRWWPRSINRTLFIFLAWLVVLASWTEASNFIFATRLSSFLCYIEIRGENKLN